MKNKLLLIGLTLLVAISLIAVGCQSAPQQATTTPAQTDEPVVQTSQETITLIEANWSPAQMPPPIYLEPFDYTLTQWMDCVERQTDGQVHFDRYPTETLVKMGDMWEAVQIGICDIAMINVCAFPGQFPMTAALRVPGFFNNAIQASMVRQTLLDEGYLAPEWSDVKVLWFGTNAPHSIACRTKQIKTLDDLKGLRVANMGEPETSFLAELGAVPVAMPATEFYLALERGTVDAVCQDTNGLIAFQLYQVAPYITEIPGNATSCMVVVMNKDKYNELPQDMKAVFDQSTDVLRSICHGKRFDYSHDVCVDYLNEIDDAPPVYVLPEAERAKFFQTIEPLIDNALSDLESQGMPAREMFARSHELVEMYSTWGF